MKPPRIAATAAVGTALAPLLLLAAAPAQAAGVPIEPVDVPGELPYCEESPDPAPVTVELVGVPENAPPTEWAEFTYRVTNTGDEPLDTVYTYAYMWTHGLEGEDDAFPFEFEWNPDGSWRDVPFESDSANGYFGAVHDLPPGASAETTLRGRTLDEGRAGWVELTGRVRHDVQGENALLCGYAEAEDASFDVEAPREPAPEEPGAPAPDDEADEADDAAAAAGPRSGNQPEPQSELAETGSSDALPALAALGAGALVAGTGATVLARRRTAAARLR